MNKEHFSDTVRRELMETLECESQENLRKNYLRMVLRYHPDKNPNDPDASQLFHKVRENYEILRDDDKFSEHVTQKWREFNTREIINFFELPLDKNPEETRRMIIDNALDVLYHPWEIPYDFYHLAETIILRKEPIRLVLTDEDVSSKVFIENYYKVFKIYTIEENLYNNNPNDHEIEFMISQL